MITIAIDAMGGDKAPNEILLGANNFLKNNSDVKIMAFGVDLVSNHERMIIIPTESFVKNDSKPSSVIRSWKKTSIGLAIASVKEGKSEAVVSSGNTGAFMALSKIILKTFKNIERPAIPAVLPTLKGRVLMLDLGANLVCSKDQLVQFALMGEALASHLFNKKYPSVGLLNVGSEDTKGSEILQETFKALKEIPDFKFHGFVEGDDISKGTTDVIVTDGFSGNIALKAIEGTAKLIGAFAKESFSASLLGKIASIIGYRSVLDLKKKLDPRLYNGAMFLGVNGIAVKSHGGTDSVGFENALNVACQMIKSNVLKSLNEKLSRFSSI